MAAQNWTHGALQARPQAWPQGRGRAHGSGHSSTFPAAEPPQVVASEWPHGRARVTGTGHGPHGSWHALAHRWPQPLREARAHGRRQRMAV